MSDEVLELLDLEPIAARLKSECGSLRLVGELADLASAAKTSAAASPAAFVILTGANGQQFQEGSGPLRQVLAVTVSVLIRVNLSGPGGANGKKALKTPTGQIRKALFGWTAPGAELPFVIADEALEDFNEATGVSLYRIDVSTQVRILENLS